MGGSRQSRRCENPGIAPASRKRKVVAAPSSLHATLTMKANKGRDTKPELELRSLLHAKGLRYRVNLRMKTKAGVAVRPDIVFSRLRIAVFVDGCFWHSCPVHGGLPQSNRAFWREKLSRNARRDQEQQQALEADGWEVLRFWEHDDPREAAKRTMDTVIRRRRAA